MSLQRKCLAASAVSHGLLLVVVLVGSAFIPPKPVEDLITIDLVDINAMVIDEPNMVGGGNPKAGSPDAGSPPRRQLPVPEPSAPAPVPAPAEVVKREPKPEREPEPKPEPVKEAVQEPPREKVKEPPREVEKEPEPKPRKPEPDPEPKFNIAEKAVHKEIKPPTKPAPKFDLARAEKMTIKPGPRASDSKESSTSEADARAERASKAAQARAGALSQAMSRLQGGLSKGIGEVGIPGPGGQAYASYGLVLRKIYEEAWIPPHTSRGNDPIVAVSVVIRRDGTVVSRRITRKSGRTELDRSVQRALDRVNKVPAFPSGSTDEQRTFEIEFNLTDKLGVG